MGGRDLLVFYGKAATHDKSIFLFSVVTASLHRWRNNTVEEPLSTHSLFCERSCTRFIVTLNSNRVVRVRLDRQGWQCCLGPCVMAEQCWLTECMPRASLFPC